MTKIIFFDTETTGLPRDYSVGALERDKNWPDLVSICWVVYDGRERQRKEVHVIRPEGFVIPPESVKIHGISQHQAEWEGKSLKEVLSLFLEDVREAQLLIAHNMEFDRNVLFHSFRWRLGIDPMRFWPTASEFCSMKEATDEMRLPSKGKAGAGAGKGKGGYKAPRLMELYGDQFGCGFDGAHTADGDVEALVKIVWARWDIQDADGRVL